MATALTGLKHATAYGSGPTKIGGAQWDADHSVADVVALRAALELTIGPALHVRRTTTQSITSGVTTKVAFDSVVTDTGSAWNAGSNRYTPQVPGWYQVAGMVYCVGSSPTSVAALLYKNGALEVVGFEISPSGASGGFGAPVSTLVEMNGTTDYLELFGNFAATSPVFAATYTYMKILHLRG